MLDICSQQTYFSHIISICFFFKILCLLCILCLFIPSLKVWANEVGTFFWNWNIWGWSTASQHMSISLEHRILLDCLISCCLSQSPNLTVINNYSYQTTLLNQCWLSVAHVEILQDVYCKFIIEYDRFGLLANQQFGLLSRYSTSQRLFVPADLLSGRRDFTWGETLLPPPVQVSYKCYVGYTCILYVCTFDSKGPSVTPDKR